MATTGFSTELARLMAEQHISVRALAELSGYSKTHIDELKRGERGPSPEAAQDLDDALHADGQLLSKVPRKESLPSARTVRRSGHPVVDLADTDTVDVPVVDAEGRVVYVTVPRRVFLASAGLAAASLAALPPDGGGSEADEDTAVMSMLREADRTDVGDGTLNALQQVFEKLCRDYLTVPSADLRQKLRRLFAQLMTIRRGRLTLAQHREVVALTGWATALLACVNWGDNEREAAEACRLATLRSANEAGHGELRTWSLELQAWFALTEGRYRDVLAIATEQATVGDNSASIQLTMQGGRAAARLGDRKAAESAIQRAHDFLTDHPASGPRRHFVYDGSKWPFYAASCYTALGDADRAEELANQVIKDCEQNWAEGQNQMRLADTHILLGHVHARRGDPEAAAASGIRALSFQHSSGPWLLLQAGDLEDTLTQRFPGTQPAGDFSTFYRTVCAQHRYERRVS